MSATPEENLMDLLIQLKKIGPDEVRSILNPQPQIAYGLFELMVNLDVVDLDALNKAVASFSAVQQSQPAAPIQTSPPIYAPAPVVPNHNMQEILQPGTTSQLSHDLPLSAPSNGIHGGQMQYSQAPVPPPINAPPAAYPQSYPPAPALPAGLSPEVLNALPEEQRTMVMQMISITPAQLEMLPPAERMALKQLRQAFGLP